MSTSQHQSTPRPDRVTHVGTDQFETIQSAAARLGVSVSTVREWIVQGLLPSYKLGVRAIRLRVVDVDGMLQSRPLPTGNER